MRKVHLRYNQVVNIGRTKTACGFFTIFGTPDDMSPAVVEFQDFRRKFEATTHGTLVTCENCLAVMKR